VAIVIVASCYTFFAGGGTFDFRRLTSWEDSYYASQAEGFFRGHLYIERAVDPKLLALPNPYDLKAREGIYYLWDASYLNGRYYLYFSPLPVLLVHMPHRLLRGSYPPDQLVALIFAIWAFLAAVVFTRRALAASGAALNVPFSLWVLLIGLGNVVLFVLTAVHTYEVAILTGMAMTAMWSLAMQKFNEGPTSGRSIWVGIWLSLAIASRPNLGVLLPVSALVIVLAARKRTRPVRLLLFFLLPLGIVASAMFWYNAARFVDPREFGTRYQLTHLSMEDRRICSLCTLPEAARFANNVTHYLFWPMPFQSTFPYLVVMPATLDRAVSWPRPNALTEQVVGLFPLLPLAVPGTLFAMLLALGLRREPLDSGARTALQVTVGAWLILLALSTCWWIVARYSLDFMMLFAAASVICIESGLTALARAGVRVSPLRAGVVALCCYSIVIGLFLGVIGPGDAFKRANPSAYQRIAGWFQ